MRDSLAFDEAEAGDEKSCHWVITNPVLERVLQVTFRLPLSQVPVAITLARRATQLLKGIWLDAPFFGFQLEPYCRPSLRVPSGLNSAAPAKFWCYLNGKNNNQ